MKFHKLRLLNLNSLQGCWEIDFVSPLLMSEGLFLIAGSTGAGKSTILDAICLALYGVTPRLDKINEGSNEIMSRGSGECSAQLSFSMSETGEVYVAQWSQRRAHKKPAGALQKVERQISQISSGKILAEKISEADSKIEELTGLGFEQFKRSILLAQGDFAAFLEASKNERTDILEKITGTEIYRQLSVSCFERYKQEKMELELLQKEQELHLPLNVVVRQKLEDELLQAGQQEQEVSRQRVGLEHLWQNLQVVAQVWSQYLLLEQEAKRFAKSFDRVQQEARKQLLQRNNQAREIQPIQQRQEEQQVELQKAQITLHNSQENFGQLQEQWEQLRNGPQGLESLQEKLAEEQEFQKLFSDRYKQLQKLEWQNQTAKEQLAEANQKRDSLQEQLAEREAEQGGQQQLGELQGLIDVLQQKTLSQVLSMPDAELQLQYLQLKELHDKYLQNVVQVKEWHRIYYETREQQHNLQRQLKELGECDFVEEVHALQQELEQWRNTKVDERVGELQLPALPSCMQLKVEPAKVETASSASLAKHREEVQEFPANTNVIVQQQALDTAWSCCLELVRPLDRYLEKRKFYGRIQEEGRAASVNLQQQEQELHKVAADLQKQETQLKLQGRYCKTLEENLKLHQRLLIFAEERSELEEGSSCPLCGSRKHAFDETVQASPDIQAMQDEFTKQQELLAGLQNAVAGDREELGKYRLQVKNSRQSAQKQFVQAQACLDELQELRQNLQSVLAQYEERGYEAAALQPQLFQELCQPDAKTWHADASSLFAELNLVRGKIEACQGQIRQAVEWYRQQRDEEQRNIAQCCQKLEQQLVQVEKRQQEAKYQYKEWTRDLDNCQKSLEELDERLAQEFERRFAPYAQWLEYLQSQKGQAQVAEVFGEVPRCSEGFLIVLKAVSKPGGTTPSTGSFEQIWELMNSAELRNALGQHVKQLEEYWENLRCLQKEQAKLPLAQERQQQAEQKAQELEEVLQQQVEAQERQQKLEQQWQQNLQQLLEKAPHVEVDVENWAQQEQGLEEWSHFFTTHLQEARMQKDGCLNQVSELEKQIEGQKQLLEHFHKQVLELQQSAEQGGEQWWEALRAAGFRDTADFDQAVLDEQQHWELEQELRSWEEKLLQLQRNWYNNGQVLSSYLEGFLQDWARQSHSELVLQACAERLKAAWNMEKLHMQKVLDCKEASILRDFYAETANNRDASELSQSLQDLQQGLEALLRQVREASNEAQQGLGVLKNQLQNDDELRLEQQEGMLALQHKKDNLQYWELLNNLIGQSDGTKFSRFAQQLTFEKLLLAANQYLKKVSDRYLLQAERDNPLEFFVRDFYQSIDQGLRPSQNLSGGEKFLVSLCLALGLSQLSAQKVTVQSLFLDEGFGTLDEETLHNTLELLGSLRSDGKLIGVISHVPLLKERIMCQIRLETLGEGRSSIHSKGIVQSILLPASVRRKKKSAESKAGAARGELSPASQEVVATEQRHSDELF